MKSFVLIVLASLVLASVASADVSAGQWAKALDVDGVDVGACGNLEKGRACFLAFGTGTYTPTSQSSAQIAVQSDYAVVCLDGDIAATTAGGSVAGIYKFVAATGTPSANSFVLLPTSGLPTASSDQCYTLVPGLYYVAVTTSGSLQSAVSIQGY